MFRTLGPTTLHTAVAITLAAGLPLGTHAQCEPRFIVDNLQGYGFTAAPFLGADAGLSFVSRGVHWDPDGDGPQSEWLVLGGRFNRAANVNSLSIVAWDGTQWRGFGSGLPPLSPLPAPTQVFNAPSVIAMGTFQGQLIVNDGSLKVWNGSGWTPINPSRQPSFSGTQSTDLIEHQGALHVGGLNSFIGPNNQIVNRPLVARVVGENFESLGPALPSFGNSARKLLSRPEGLYAAGSFSTLADGTVLNNVALWNGSQWSSVGGGVNAACEDAAVINDQLYVVGSFTQAGNTPARAVARYDGINWHQVGDGSLTSATALIEINGAIYVAGQRNSQTGVFRLDGDAWTWLEGGFRPIRLTQDNGELIALGNTATGQDQGVQFPAHDALRLTANGWTALGAPYAYSRGAGVVYQGRLISELGPRRDRYQDRFGEWDGSTWRTFEMPGGFFPRLASTGTRLFGYSQNSLGSFTVRVSEYLSGDWQEIEGTFTFSGIAQYDLIEFANEVYLFGSFTSLDGQPVQGLARAVAGAWVPVSLPTQSASVTSAAVHNGQLFLTGQFRDADGQISSFASFDGVTLTRYPNPSPGRLLSDGTTLFASSGARVAAWNGSAFVDYWMAPQGASFSSVFIVDGRMWATLVRQTQSGFASVVTFLARRGDNGNVDFTSESVGIRGLDPAINSAFAVPVVFGSEIHLFGEFNQIGSPDLPGNRVAVNWARFTTDGVPLVVTQPTDVTASCGEPVTLRAIVANGYETRGDLEYQWFRNGVALSETQFVRGVNNDTLSIPALAQPFTGFYTLTVTNDCGTATTREILVTGDSVDCRACPPCPADFDLDGGVTASDVASFFASFETGNACADVDDDGSVTGTDLAAFFAVFEAGGC